jgi:hypothetical protein
VGISYSSYTQSFDLLEVREDIWKKPALDATGIEPQIFCRERQCLSSGVLGPPQEIVCDVNQPSNFNYSTLIMSVSV